MALELLELKALTFLLLHGPSRKGDLVKALGVNWGRATRVLEALMEKGLVVKALSFRERPTHVYMVTREGIRELERILRELRESLKRAGIQ